MSQSELTVTVVNQTENALSVWLNQEPPIADQQSAQIEPGAEESFSATAANAWTVTYCNAAASPDDAVVTQKITVPFILTNSVVTIYSEITMPRTQGASGSGDKITLVNRTREPLAFAICDTATAANSGPYTPDSTAAPVTVAAGDSNVLTLPLSDNAGVPWVVAYAGAGWDGASTTACGINYVYPGAVITIGTEITPTSPFFDLSRNLLLNGGFESSGALDWTVSPSNLAPQARVQYYGQTSWALSPYVLFCFSNPGDPAISVSQNVTAITSGWYVLTGCAMPKSSQCDIQISVAVNGQQQAVSAPGNDQYLCWWSSRMKFMANAGDTITVSLTVAGGNEAYFDDIFLASLNNLLDNPSFETNNLSPWEVVGQQQYDGNWVVGTSSQNPCGSGQYNCYIYGYPNLSSAGIFQELKAPYDGNFQFLCYARTNLADGAQIGANVAGVVAAKQEFMCDTEYAPYSVRFNARLGDTIRVWCGVSRGDVTGWVTLDDCTLNWIGEIVAD